MSTEPLRCAGALVADDDGRLFPQRRSPQRRRLPDCLVRVDGDLTRRLAGDAPTALHSIGL